MNLKWKLLAVVMNCLAAAVAKPLLLSSKHNYSNKQVLFHESNVRNTTYLYAVCEPAREAEVKICDVKLETDNFDGSNETISCPVAFGKTVRPLIQLVLVGDDKAAILWTEENERDFYLNIANVHMRDGCRKNEIRTLLPLDVTLEARGSVDVLPFEDTYDIVLRDVLGDSKLCRGTFDVDGNVLANISSWDPLGKKLLTDRFVNLNKHSRKIGYFTVGHQKDEIQFILVKDDGAKVFKTWNKTEYISPEVKYSTDYDTLGACLLFDYDNVNCTFFDLDGEVKQEASLRCDRKHFHGVQNLPEGFLTVTKECLKDGKFITPQWKCPHNLKYFLARYDAQGKQVKKIEIEEHEWDNNDAFDFFKNNAGEQCVTITNYDYLKSLQVNSYCFPDL